MLLIRKIPVCAALALSILACPAAETVNPALWSGLKYRMIGPERGGRVTTVTGVPSQPNTFYMGSTGGGVWKTTDAGHNWVNVSDGQIPLGSMGAIEVSLSDPNVIYAGTGSSKIRSNVSIGRGIYKSTDAGKTWTFAGLRDVGQIATVRVHPANPDMVWVAALGNPFADNPERGVYRTTDGGKNWQKVLYISDSAGAADLELQPGSPNVVFACMWHGQRKPWTIISGAREGGIYKSTDSGLHWTKLAGGLPNELFGRSNVAISAAAPNRIYALIEAKPGSGLYRSEDAGATWSLVNGAANLITRPFYYDTLGVDPNNADVVLVGDEGWFKSTDGGKSFRPSPAPHGDHHDVWINPKNSQFMIQSNDGGANVSLDGGRTWSTQMNQPTAEIYQVAVDDQYPYRVYGAQQDNTTVIVPSLPLGNGQDFRVGPGCETGPIIPDVKRPELVYGSCKGQFSRLNLNTSNEERYWIGVQSLYGNPGGDLIYRFQRVSPMEVSPARFAHRLLRLAIRPPHARWRRHLGKDQSRSHRPPRRHAGRERRTHHPRRHRRRGLQHALLHPRIAPAKGPHLGRLQRRPDPRHARRRQDLDQRHAQRPPARRARAEPRTRHPQTRHRLRRHLSLPAGRFHALHLPHRRFRQDLDPAHRRQERHRRR